MNTPSLTPDQIKGLIQQVDIELVFAESRQHLYRRLNDEYGAWVLLRAPVICHGFYLAVVVKGR